jgi:hypothetical protein
MDLSFKSLLQTTVLILKIFLDSLKVLLGLLLANDGLTRAGLESLDHAVVVALNLFALIFLLLDLDLHELYFLLGDSLVLLILILQALVFLLDLFKIVL